MGLGWFDAIAGAAAPIATGLQTGRLQAEELQRKQAEEALRNQLLQAQIEYYGRGRDEYHPASMDEAIKYELGIHPERTARPEGFNQSEWVKAGFPDQESYLQYLGKKSRTEFPERFRPPAGISQSTANDEAEGLAILGSPGDQQVIGPFGQAYQAVRTQNPQMKPGLVAKRAMEGLRSTRPDLFRADGGGFEEEYKKALGRAGGGGGGGTNQYGEPDEGVPRADVPDPIYGGAPAAVPAPTAPAPPSGANPSGKRPVSQDQADYLRATGKWDDALFEVVQ